MALIFVLQCRWLLPLLEVLGKVAFLPLTSLQSVSDSQRSSFSPQACFKKRSQLILPVQKGKDAIAHPPRSPHFFSRPPLPARAHVGAVIVSASTWPLCKFETKIPSPTSFPTTPPPHSAPATLATFCFLKHVTTFPPQGLCTSASSCLDCCSLPDLLR